MPTPSPTKRAKKAVLALMLRDNDELRRTLDKAAQTKNALSIIGAQLNARLLTVQQGFAAEIDELNSELKEHEAAVARYIEAHREKVFSGNEKTAQIGPHEISIRDNGGAVATIGKLSQQGALDRLIACEGDDEAIADLFVTWKASLNKRAVQELYEQHADFLMRIGLKIEHEEKLSIDYGHVTETSSKSAPVAVAS